MIPLMDSRNLSIPLVMLIVCVVMNIVIHEYYTAMAWGCAAIWCLLCNRSENQYTKDIGRGWKRRSKQ
jgi:hypothetical protein